MATLGVWVGFSDESVIRHGKTMTSQEVINAPTEGRANRRFVRKVKMTLFAFRK